MTNPHDPDSIVDAALREYSRHEPLRGLEERILQRIQTAPAARQSWWWAVWVLATTIAVAVLLLRTGRTRVDPAPPPISVKAAKRHATAPPLSPVVAQVRAKRPQLP